MCVCVCVCVCLFVDVCNLTVIHCIARQSRHVMYTTPSAPPPSYTPPSAPPADFSGAKSDIPTPAFYYPQNSYPPYGHTPSAPSAPSMPVPVNLTYNVFLTLVSSYVEGYVSCQLDGMVMIHTSKDLPE